MRLFTSFRGRTTKAHGRKTYNNLLIAPVLIDFSLTVKAATLIFISGRGSAISSAMDGKSGFICNLVKSY